MKKSFLGFVVVTLLFSGCKKNKDQPDTNYYVRFKLNGSLVTNTKANYGWLKPNASFPGMVDFQLSSTTDDFKNNLGITVEKTGGVNTGTYSSTNNSYTVIADYFKNQGDPAERDYTIEDATGMTSVAFTITLTDITPTYFKGTFTGNYLYDPAYHETIAITEGEFYVKHNP